MHCILHFIFWSIFGSFLLALWTPESRKIEPPLKGEHDFTKIAFRSWHRFLIPFWAQLCFILASKIHQNPSKNRFQEALKNWSILGSIFNWFWLRFGGQVGAMLATFLGPRPPKRPPRPLQDASKTPPRRSKMPPKTLWIAQDGPRGLQTCPGSLQTSILDDFWSIFGPFLIDVWLIVGWFLINFPSIFYYISMLKKQNTI